MEMGCYGAVSLFVCYFEFRYACKASGPEQSFYC
jgi:hypothetical protein